MKRVMVVVMIISMVESCTSECITKGSAFHMVRDRALLNHVFKSKTESSPVNCVRQCFTYPQCVSVNYHITTRLCELNDGSRSHDPDDFVELQGSVYYDDNVNNTLYPAQSTASYSSCLMMYQAGYHRSGIYTIYPTSPSGGLQVYCDMETDGGGWIVFQRRQDGSVDFYRNWTEYQSGFGDLHNEFWLWNDILRDLTGSGQWQLRVHLEDWQSNRAWASYGEFGVTGDKYTLHVGSYDAKSTAGDSLIAWHNGRSFTTKDQVNDVWSENCAVTYTGAWWYRNCHTAHLNGVYFQEADAPFGQGTEWMGWKGRRYSLKKCSMKIRQVI